MISKISDKTEELPRPTFTSGELVCSKSGTVVLCAGSSKNFFSGIIVYSPTKVVGTYENDFVKEAFEIFTQQITMYN